MDRPSKDELREAQKYDIELITDYSTGNFKAAKMRNLGYKRAIELGAKLIISLDGDMIPESDESLYPYLQGFDLMVGKRRQKEFMGFDQRELSGFWLKNIFFEDKINRPYTDIPQYLEHGGVLWSCNFAFTSEMYERICNYNLEKTGKYEFFRELDWYGGDDTILGYILCKNKWWAYPVLAEAWHSYHKHGPLNTLDEAKQNVIKKIIMEE